MSKIFRVTWEQRSKLACRGCCTESNHPWSERSEPATDAKAAEKQESRLYDMESYEVRNIRTEYAETTEWSEYRSWEHKE